MTEQQNKIWDYLLAEKVFGHSSAIKLKTIAAVIGVECIGSNCKNVRSIIKEMVELHGLPIGTSKKGVFVIVSEEDIETAVKWVERPNRGDNIRKNGIYTKE
jgi:hypothetical protein